MPGRQFSAAGQREPIFRRLRPRLVVGGEEADGEVLLDVAATIHVIPVIDRRRRQRERAGLSPSAGPE